MSDLVQRPIPSNWEPVHQIVESQIRADGAHEWPFVPSLPVDVRSFTFHSDKSRRHTHHEYFELMLIHSGSALYEVGSGEFKVGPSDLIVINGVIPHRLAKVLEAPCNAVVLYFQPDVLRSPCSAEEYIQFLMPFLVQEEMLPPLIAGSTSLPGQILDLILGIQHATQTSTDLARLEVETYLQMILVKLINYYRDHLLAADAFDRWQHSFDRFRPLFKFIGEHFREPISLARATEVVGMSKPHFMRSFKRLTGQSFDTYLNHYRITKAQSLLASTDLPVAAVGQRVGFSDQSYFGLIFRRLLQLTPRDYRKSLLSR